MYLYNLINIHTNEVKENLMARDVAKILNTYAHDVCKLARNGTITQGTYKVEVVGKTERKSEPAFPKEDLEEWDRVTSKLRRYFNENKDVN